MTADSDLGPIELGRLERVDVHAVWGDQVPDLTSWFARNIDLLSQTLGVEITPMQRELRVDDLTFNMVGTDPNGRPVVIENHLDPTSHAQIGAVVVHASSLPAALMVWIAPQFRDDHRRTLRWLNERTDGKVHFFAIELGLVRIGTSLPAPVLELVVQPRDWGARDGARKEQDTAEIPLYEPVPVQHEPSAEERSALLRAKRSSRRERPERELPLPDEVPVLRPQRVGRERADRSDMGRLDRAADSDEDDERSAQAGARRGPAKPGGGLEAPGAGAPLDRAGAPAARPGLGEPGHPPAQDHQARPPRQERARAPRELEGSVPVAPREGPRGGRGEAPREPLTGEWDARPAQAGRRDAERFFEGVRAFESERPPALPPAARDHRPPELHRLPPERERPERPERWLEPVPPLEDRTPPPERPPQPSPPERLLLPERPLGAERPDRRSAAPLERGALLPGGAGPATGPITGPITGPLTGPLSDLSGPIEPVRPAAPREQSGGRPRRSGVHALASFQSSGDRPANLSPVEEQRYRFFEQMFESVAMRRPGFRIPKFGHDSWVGFSAGPFGFYDVAFTTNGTVRAGIYLDMQDRAATKRLFDELAAERLAIEAAVGRALSWERLDDRRASRVVDYHNVGDLAQPDELWMAADWAADTIVRLMDALDSRLRSRAQVLLARSQGL